MKTSLKMALCAATLAFAGLSATSASAVTLTPIGADCADDVAVGTTLPFGANTCGQADNRDDVSAIDINSAPMGTFYSLGLGGGLTFSIDPAATGAGLLFEVTNPSSHNEALDIYVSNSGLAGDWVLVTPRIINNSAAPATTQHNFTLPAGSYTYIGFLDVTLDEFGASGTQSTDGFDIGAISLTAVPLPASAWMLLAALGGVGFMSRRKA